MPSDIPPITFGTFFHIYNSGNNHENIFFQERNYAYFMELWWKHTSQTAETWAYCLLRNHFHAVVFIKNKEDLTGLTGNPAADTVRGDTGITPSDSRRDLSGLNNKTKEPSQYFSNFFNAYARGVNIATQRTGAVFERPFKRIPVDNEAYLMRLIVYVHQNPQKHKFENDFRDWNYSSYHELIANIPTPSQPPPNTTLKVYMSTRILAPDLGEGLREAGGGGPKKWDIAIIWKPGRLYQNSSGNSAFARFRR